MHSPGSRSMELGKLVYIYLDWISFIPDIKARALDHQLILLKIKFGGLDYELFPFLQ